MKIKGFRPDGPLAVVIDLDSMDETAFRLIGALLEDDSIATIECGNHHCVKTDGIYHIDGLPIEPYYADAYISLNWR